MKLTINTELLDFIKEKINYFFQNENIKVYLYGSRARGDNHNKSDYDFAFSIPNNLNDSNFLLSIKDDAPTLNGIDAVNLSKVNKELKENILNGGVLIYESK